MTISFETLQAEELRLKYKELLKAPSVYPTIANWEYIILNKMEGLGDLLYNKYKSALQIDEDDRDELHSIAIDKFPEYLNSISFEYAADIVYSHLEDGDVAINLIRECYLFSAKHIAQSISQSHNLQVLDVIDVYRKNYDEFEYRAMINLNSILENLPQLGRIENVRGLFSSSTKYMCPNGHVNDISAQYCTHSNCGLDCYGLNKNQSERIERFRHRLKALENLINA